MAHKPGNQISPETEVTDPHGTMSVKTTSLGDLSLLPRELRDMVYMATLIPNGASFWLQESDLRESGTTKMQWCGLNFGILHTSSIIRHEALPILFAHGIFEFNLTQWPNEITDDDLLWVDGMMNLAFDFGAGIELPNSVQGPVFKPAEPLTFFTGNGVQRNTCTIHLRDCAQDWPIFADTPLFLSISHLTGFKTVELVFTKARDFEGGQVVPLNHPLYLSFEEFTRRAAGYLKWNLGSSVIEEVSEDDRTRSFLFHPRSE